MSWHLKCRSQKKKQCRNTLNIIQKNQKGLHSARKKISKNCNTLYNTEKSMRFLLLWTIPDMMDS